MTGHGDIPMTVRAMKAGAVEFLTKPFRDQDMLDAVQLALRARPCAARKRERRLPSSRPSFETLTPREQEIMALVTAGLMNKQIAAEIGVSEITVKVHRGNVMRKMGARSLADLVRMADILGMRRAPVADQPIPKYSFLLPSPIVQSFTYRTVEPARWSARMSSRKENQTC